MTDEEQQPTTALDPYVQGQLCALIHLVATNLPYLLPPDLDPPFMEDLNRMATYNKSGEESRYFSRGVGDTLTAFTDTLRARHDKAHT